MPTPPGAGAPPQQIITDRDGVEYQLPNDWSDDQVRSYVQGQYAQRHPQPSPNQPPTYQMPGTAPGTVQPRGGPEVPAAGVPPLSDDAQRARAALQWQTMLSAGTRQGVQGAMDVLQTDPSYQYQKALSEKLAGNEATYSEARKLAGAGVLPSLYELQDGIRNITETDWGKIAGPYNAVKQPARSESPMSYAAWNAPDTTPVHANAAYGHNAGDPEALRLSNLQTTVEHMIGAVTEANAAAGTKAQMGSDARMQLVLDLLHQSLQVSTRKDAINILHYAEDTMRRMYGLNPALSPGAPGSYQSPVYVKDPILQSPDLYREGTHFLDKTGRITVPAGSPGSMQHPLHPKNPDGSDMTPQQARQNYWPGTYIVVPSGPNQGKTMPIAGGATP